MTTWTRERSEELIFNGLQDSLLRITSMRRLLPAAALADLYRGVVESYAARLVELEAQS